MSAPDRLRRSIEADRASRQLEAVPELIGAPRRWVIEDHGTRPLTLNRLADLHRQQWARHTVTVRQLWMILARKAKIPRLQQVTIDVVPLHANNASPQDPGACAPEAKAAVDGLVDARVIPDDNGRHVLGLFFHPPEVCGHNGMRLIVTEITNPKEQPEHA